jgi:quinol monooxygenase YgiN
LIIVTATITPKPGERDNIISKSRDLIESSLLESGCISYKLYANTDDDVLMMFEQWENLEVLKAHMQTKNFKAFGTAIEDILARKLDIAVYKADKI